MNRYDLNMYTTYNFRSYKSYVKRNHINSYQNINKTILKFFFFFCTEYIIMKYPDSKNHLLRFNNILLS